MVNHGEYLEQDTNMASDFTSDLPTRSKKAVHTPTQTENVVHVIEKEALDFIELRDTRPIPSVSK